MKKQITVRKLLILCVRIPVIFVLLILINMGKWAEEKWDRANELFPGLNR